MASLLKWLEASPVGASVRESLWLFPAIETVHLLGMATLVGSVAAFDLRLLGVALRGQRVTALARLLLPWAWAGFAVQVVTGTLLFSSEAVHVYANPAFRFKMLLIALAGAHALVFHWVIARDVTKWDDGRLMPAKAKVAGFISLLIWVGVVAAGRWIGFL